MDRISIDHWLHRFSEMGLFTVDFSEPGYSDFVDDLSKLNMDNPMQLFGLIDRCVNGEE